MSVTENRMAYFVDYKDGGRWNHFPGIFYSRQDAKAALASFCERWPRLAKQTRVICRRTVSGLVA